MRVCCLAALLAVGLWPMDAQVPSQWRLVEEWRVGGAVDGPHSFTNVRSLVVQPDGRLVVLESKDQQVHFLSARGEPMRTVGRKGAGPGEFRNANGLVVTPSDQILVNDSENARLTVLSAAGKVVQTIPHIGWGAVNQWDARFNVQGHLAENGVIVIAIDPTKGPIALNARRTWNADFTHADTVKAPECGNIPTAKTEDVAYRLPSPSGRGYQSLQYPFVMSGRSQITAPDGTHWIGLAPQYRTIVAVAFESCKPTATIVLRGPEIPVPGDVRAEIGAMLGRSASRGSALMGPDPGKVRRALSYFEALAVDASNRVWVERLVPGSVKFTATGASGERRFDVYSAQGTLVAEVKVPAGLRTPRSGRPFVITDEHVYAFATDADDAPYLVALRIIRD